MINGQKFIKRNTIETFKYEASALLDTYESIIDGVIKSRASLFGASEVLDNHSFFEEVRELRARLSGFKLAGASQSAQKQALKDDIRIFLDKQHYLKQLLLRSEQQLFEPLSREAILQSRKHSCNAIFFSNVLKRRQQLIDYFGIDVVASQEDEEEQEQINSIQSRSHSHSPQLAAHHQ